MTEEYTEGDLVWGKMPNYPWWPGIVTQPPDGRPLSHLLTPVKFFPDNADDYGVLTQKNVLPFNTPQRDKLIKKARAFSKKRTSVKLLFDNSLIQARKLYDEKHWPLTVDTGESSDELNQQTRVLAPVNTGCSEEIPQNQHSRLSGSDDVCSSDQTSQKVNNVSGNHTVKCVNSVKTEQDHSITTSQKKRKKKKDDLSLEPKPGSSSTSSKEMNMSTTGSTTHQPILSSAVITPPHVPSVTLLHTPKSAFKQKKLFLKPLSCKAPSRPSDSVLSLTPPHNMPSLKFSSEPSVPYNSSSAGNTPSKSRKRTASQKQKEERVDTGNCCSPEEPPPVKRLVSKLDHMGIQSSQSERLREDGASCSTGPAQPVSDIGQESISETRAYEDDDDGDLPDILAVSDTISIKKGDLVWVQYQRFPYWPAVVTNFYKKKKRISLVFIGEINFSYGRSQGICLSYKKSKIVPFGKTHSEHEKFKDIGRESTFKVQHDEAVTRAEDFLRKTVLGEAKVFEYFAEELRKAMRYNSGATAEEDWSEEESMTEEETPHPTPPESGKEEENEEEEEECYDLEEEEEDDEPHLPAKEQRRLQKRKEKNQKLVDFIKSDAMKIHLLEIYKGRKANYFQKRYDEAQKKSLVRSYTCGPIDDEDQIWAIKVALGELYKDASQTTVPNSTYIDSVWLPEAVVYALIKLKGYSRGRAVEAFQKGASLSNFDQAMRHEEIMRSARNILPEDQARYDRRRQEVTQRLLQSGRQT